MLGETKKSVSVGLPLELYWKLRKQAEAGNRSLAGYIRLILKRYVEYLEKQKDQKDDWLFIR